MVIKQDIKQAPIDDSPHRTLAADIVYKAVSDWQLLIKKRDWLNERPDARCNFTELRSFFKSEFCYFLLSGNAAAQRRILEGLEREYNTARNGACNGL